MFESSDKLVLGLVTGFAFGFLLQKGRVAKFHTILGQLLLRDWTVMKIMTTAIAVGAVGVYALVDSGQASLDIWPVQVGGIAAGALLFGIGLAVFGYCPGTSVTACGEGSRDAMAGVVGMAFGAMVFVTAFPALQQAITAVGDFGKLRIFDVLNVSPWSVIAVLAFLTAAVVLVLERYERRRMPPGSTPAAPLTPRASRWWAAFVSSPCSHVK